MEGFPGTDIIMCSGPFFTGRGRHKSIGPFLTEHCNSSCINYILLNSGQGHIPLGSKRKQHMSTPSDDGNTVFML